jgi:hypothetical protein
MKAGMPHDSSPETPGEGNDPLWQLLACAPRPEPDSWFVIRTLARCRRERATTAFSLKALWRWLLAGGLGVGVAAVLVVAQVRAEKVDKQKNVQEAFEIVASIDSDTDSSSSSWQDSSL